MEVVKKNWAAESSKAIKKRNIERLLKATNANQEANSVELYMYGKFMKVLFLNVNAEIYYYSQIQKEGRNKNDCWKKVFHINGTKAL